MTATLEGADAAPTAGEQTPGDDIGGVRSNATRALAAIGSQGIVAGSSLVLQWLALWKLGAAGLGTFAILSGGLQVTATALHTGWVGDPLALVDRHHPPIRRALVRVFWIALVASGVFGLIGGVVFAGMSPASSSLFGLSLVAWVVEETGRRLLMARFEFVALAINDAVYALAAIVTASVVVVTGRLTIDWLVGAMLVGSLAAIAASVVQLPASELRPGPRVEPEFRELASFSLWRSGQLGMRPLSMLGSRVIVAALTSTATLGLLEAGRLLVAPIMTASNGFGGFILPYFARRHRHSGVDMGLVGRVMAASAGLAVAAIPSAFLLRGFVEKANDSGAVPTGMIVAWCIFAVGYSANIPLVNALTSLRHTRFVFWGRVVDALLVLLLTWAAVAAGRVDTVPVVMTIGMAIGSIVPVIVLWRSGEVPVPELVLRMVRGEAPAPSALWDGRTQRMRPIFVLVSVLSMIVASDYKWRRRELSGSLGGSLDLAILLEVGVYAVIGLWLALDIANPPRFRRPTAVQFFIRGWVATEVVSVLWSLYPQLGGVRAAQLMVMLVFCMAVASSSTRPDMHLVAHGYLVLSTVSVGIGAVWRVPFSELQADRFNWMAVHSVVAAAILAIAVVIAVAYLFRGGERHLLGAGTVRWAPWAYVLVLVVCGGGLLATKTRGSVGAAFVGLLVVAGLSMRRRDRVPGLLVGVLGVAVSAVLFLNPIIAYAERGESAESLKSFNSRLPLWELAFDLIGRRPLLGWGMTSSRGLFFEAIGLGGAHNAYVNVLVDTGLIGGFLWLAAIVSLFAALARLRRHGDRDVALLTGVMVTQVVNAFTTEGLGSGAGVSTIWLLVTAAWVGVAQRELAERRREARRRPVRPTARRAVDRPAQLSSARP